MRTFVLTVTGLVFSVAACSSYGTYVVEVKKTQPPVASVSVTVPLSLIAGQTARGVATLRDANGTPLTDRPVAWFSSTASIATVSGSGVISAVAPGTAVVSAVSEGVAGQATMAVMPLPPTPIASVSVSPATSSLLVGATVQFSAVTRDANNNVLTGRVVAWSSANAGIASVNSNGLVSAVSAGTTQITASSEGKSGSATITVTAAPPPPPGGSVEPAGLTVLSDRPFNSTTSTYTKGEAGWWDSGGGSGMTIAADATAPKSPSNVGSMNYPAGFTGGVSPASLELPINVTTLYVAAWVKFSSNWQGHRSGVNKILHLWIGGGNHLVITGAGFGSGPLTARISLQGIVSGGNADGGTTSTYDSPIQFIRGQWHKVEVIAVANSAGAYGSVKLYVDGVLAASCSDIQFVSGSPVWDLAMWSPTWGGIDDAVVADMHQYMDHIYVSGK